MSEKTQIFIGLDIGSKRIGVAVCNSLSRLPHPLTTLQVDDNIFTTIAGLIKEQKASAVVVGLPRSIEGNDTAQTKWTQSFIDKLNKILDIQVHVIDEAVTSVQAKAQLESQGRTYQKADVDALAAVYILEDFINVKI